MGKDYYKVLGCDRKATAEELKKAYRKLALKWHPDRCGADKKDEAQAKFQEIGEAFEILGDPEKRRVYDQVGSDGAAGFEANGSSNSQGYHQGGFQQGPGVSTHYSHSSPEDVFRSFFGTSDPFAAGNDGNPFGGGNGSFMMGGSSGFDMGRMGQGMPQQFSRSRAAKKAAPISHTLLVNLEDLYCGTTKRMRITSRKLDVNGGVIKVSTDKEIVVKAGWKDGTKITYENEGDEVPGMLPADIVFVLQTKQHPNFERQDDDLIYTCPIDLKDAITGVHTTVTTLDNRQLKIDAPFVSPDTVKILTGEGMPNPKKQKWGDLRVKFRINFPNLTASQRAQIGSILQSS